MKLKITNVEHLALPTVKPERCRVRVVLEGEVSEVERRVIVDTFQNGRTVVDMVEAMR